MKEEKENIIYTAEDIKRYITGAMAPDEMHAIEMAALDDPLLAEAMEGYELMEQKDWSKELAALKQNFNKEEKEQVPVISIAKNKTFKWWKAVAAAAVLGIAATTAYLFNDNKENNATDQLAKAETVTATTDSATITAKADSISTFAPVILADSAGQYIADANTLTTTGTTSYTFSPSSPGESSGAATDSNFIYRPGTSSSGLIAMKDDDSKSNATAGSESLAEKEYKVVAGNNGAFENAVAYNNNIHNMPGSYNNAGNYEESKSKTIPQPDVVALDKKAREDNNADANFLKYQNNFSGVVVSPDNKPVGFASIKLPQNKKPVYTDANGVFNFQSTDSLLNVTVISAGYTSQQFKLSNSVLQNKIVLEPQVVATQTMGKAKAESARRKQQAFEDSTLIDDEDAEPAGGWIEYNNYLSSNLRFPEDARQKNIHGEVEITVKLTNNGDVSQIKVDKPLCPDCDAEAIRLVKEGPKWDVKNTKKKKVKIKVKF